MRPLNPTETDPDSGHTSGTHLPGDRRNSADRGRALEGSSTAPRPRRRWKPPTGSTSRLLGLGETAAYLGLSPWSVRELQWSGRLPRVEISRKLLFDRADLDRLIETSKEPRP